MVQSKGGGKTGEDYMEGIKDRIMTYTIRNMDAYSFCASAEGVEAVGHALMLGASIVQSTRKSSRSFTNKSVASIRQCSLIRV
jgi:hypothetical protein